MADLGWIHLGLSSSLGQAWLILAGYIHVDEADTDQYRMDLPDTALPHGLSSLPDECGLAH